jgi:phenylpropionate dioxygenase-like ring-hydroxylating dioxygenase large terminal subunit
MLTNLWYGIEFSKDISSTPKKLRVLNQKLVAYRKANGKPVLMQDICPRCGASLTLGKIVGDNLVCAKDGVSVGSDGMVPNQPSLYVDAYPCEDRYGWLWGFMGDLPESERNPIPELPYLNDHQTYAHIYGNFQWNAFYARVLENGVDASHTPFVHGGSFGNPDEPEIEEYEVEHPVPTSTRATIHLTPQPSKGLWRFLYKAKREPVRTVVQWWLPNISLLEVHIPLGDLIIFNAHVPIDDHTTVSKYVALRTFFKGAWANKDSHRRVLNIFNQDKAVVEAQRPELLPYDIGEELHVKSDAVQIEFRRARQPLFDKGWGLYPRDVYMPDVKPEPIIPSPVRKNN